MYKVNKAQFLLCAAWKSQWPDHDLPEICLAGRSNVGKSSLINTLTNHQKLAKVSGTPGKTRTLNFFNINDEVCLVDVPGYGYAKVSDDIQMYQYAKYYQIPVIVVATKEDKLKRNDLKKNEKRIKETLDFQKGDMFVRFSSLNKVGIDELWQDIFKLCDNHDEIK